MVFFGGRVGAGCGGGDGWGRTSGPERVRWTSGPEYVRWTSGPECVRGKEARNDSGSRNAQQVVEPVWALKCWVLPSFMVLVM